MLALCLILAFAFLIFDTHLMMNGSSYGLLMVDDYVFASMKLFADFVLVFTVLLKLLDCYK